MKEIIDVAEEYKRFCEEKGIDYQRVTSVAPYDASTLFCPAGMQQYKQVFKQDDVVDTFANIQSCIRMNDFEATGDGTHLLHFDMMGLFSFRSWTVEQTVDFWVEFIEDRLDLVVDRATVHPDKYKDWAPYYQKHRIPVDIDKECEWSDGDIGGYCTEFYINDIEIGNIVNPLGTCIDVGFGLERLQSLVTGDRTTKAEALHKAALAIINSGYTSGPKRQGYVLRKVLRALVKAGGTMDHPEFTKEQERHTKVLERYAKLKDKHTDKSAEWWYDTHGIILEEVQ